MEHSYTGNDNRQSNYRLGQGQDQHQHQLDECRLDNRTESITECSPYISVNEEQQQKERNQTMKRQISGSPDQQYVATSCSNMSSLVHSEQHRTRSVFLLVVLGSMLLCSSNFAIKSTTLTNVDAFRPSLVGSSTSRMITDDSTTATVSTSHTINGLTVQSYKRMTSIGRKYKRHFTFLPMSSYFMNTDNSNKGGSSTSSILQQNLIRFASIVDSATSSSSLQKIFVEKGKAFTQPPHLPLSSSDGYEKVWGCSPANVFLRSHVIPSKIYGKSSNSNNPVVKIDGMADTMLCRGILSYIIEMINDSSVDELLSIEPSTILSKVHLIKPTTTTTAGGSGANLTTTTNKSKNDYKPFHVVKNFLKQQQHQQKDDDVINEPFLNIFRAVQQQVRLQHQQYLYNELHKPQEQEQDEIQLLSGQPQQQITTSGQQPLDVYNSRISLEQSVEPKPTQQQQLQSRHQSENVSDDDGNDPKSRFRNRPSLGLNGGYLQQLQQQSSNQQQSPQLYNNNYGSQELQTSKEYDLQQASLLEQKKARDQMLQMQQQQQRAQQLDYEQSLRQQQQQEEEEKLRIAQQEIYMQSSLQQQQRSALAQQQETQRLELIAYEQSLRQQAYEQEQQRLKLQEYEESLRQQAAQQQQQLIYEQSVLRQRQEEEEELQNRRNQQEQQLQMQRDSEKALFLQQQEQSNDLYEISIQNQIRQQREQQRIMQYEQELEEIRQKELKKHEYEKQLQFEQSLRQKTQLDKELHEKQQQHQLDLQRRYEQSLRQPSQEMDSHQRQQRMFDEQQQSYGQSIRQTNSKISHSDSTYEYKAPKQEIMQGIDNIEPINSASNIMSQTDHQSIDTTELPQVDTRRKPHKVKLFRRARFQKTVSQPPGQSSSIVVPPLDHSMISNGPTDSISGAESQQLGNIQNSDDNRMVLSHIAVNSSEDAPSDYVVDDEGDHDMVSAENMVIDSILTTISADKSSLVDNNDSGLHEINLTDDSAFVLGVSTNANEKSPTDTAPKDILDIASDGKALDDETHDMVFNGPLSAEVDRTLTVQDPSPLIQETDKSGVSEVINEFSTSKSDNPIPAFNSTSATVESNVVQTQNENTLVQEQQVAVPDNSLQNEIARLTALLQEKEIQLQQVKGGVQGSSVQHIESIMVPPTTASEVQTNDIDVDDQIIGKQTQEQAVESIGVATSLVEGKAFVEPISEATGTPLDSKVPSEVVPVPEPSMSVTDIAVLLKSLQDQILSMKEERLVTPKESESAGATIDPTVSKGKSLLQQNIKQTMIPPENDVPPRPRNQQRNEITEGVRTNHHLYQDAGMGDGSRNPSPSDATTETMHSEGPNHILIDMQQYDKPLYIPTDDREISNGNVRSDNNFPSELPTENEIRKDSSLSTEMDDRETVYVPQRPSDADSKRERDDFVVMKQDSTSTDVEARDEQSRFDNPQQGGNAGEWWKSGYQTNLFVAEDTAPDIPTVSNTGTDRKTQMSDSSQRRDYNQNERSNSIRSNDVESSLRHSRTEASYDNTATPPSRHENSQAVPNTVSDTPSSIYNQVLQSEEPLEGGGEPVSINRITGDVQESGATSKIDEVASDHNPNQLRDNLLRISRHFESKKDAEILQMFVQKGIELNQPEKMFESIPLLYDKVFDFESNTYLRATIKNLRDDIWIIDNVAGLSKETISRGVMLCVVALVKGCTVDEVSFADANEIVDFLGIRSGLGSVNVDTFTRIFEHIQNRARLQSVRFNDAANKEPSRLSQSSIIAEVVVDKTPSLSEKMSSRPRQEDPPRPIVEEYRSPPAEVPYEQMYSQETAHETDSISTMLPGVLGQNIQYLADQFQHMQPQAVLQRLVERGVQFKQQSDDLKSQPMGSGRDGYEKVPKSETNVFIRTKFFRDDDDVWKIDRIDGSSERILILGLISCADELLRDCPVDDVLLLDPAMAASHLGIGSQLDFKNNECFANIIDTVQKRINSQAWNLLANDESGHNTDNVHYQNEYDRYEEPGQQPPLHPEQNRDEFILDDGNLDRLVDHSRENGQQQESQSERIQKDFARSSTVPDLSNNMPEATSSPNLSHLDQSKSVAPLSSVEEPKSIKKPVVKPDHLTIQRQESIPKSVIGPNEIQKEESSTLETGKKADSGDKTQAPAPAPGSKQLSWAERNKMRSTETLLEKNIQTFSRTLQGKSNEELLEIMLQKGKGFVQPMDLSPRDLADNGYEQVPGFVSNVFVRPKLSYREEDDEWVVERVEAYSDAVISRGFLSSVVEIVEGCTTQQVVAVDPTTIADELSMRTAFDTWGKNDAFADIFTALQKQVLQSQFVLVSEMARKKESETNAEKTTGTSSRSDFKGSSTSVAPIPQIRINDSDDRKRVALLLSGGVDSAVALHLLVRQGYDVSAFYLNGWVSEEIPKSVWQNDVDACQAVVKHASEMYNVHIPFQALSIRQYQEYVVQSTLLEAEAGRAINPDLLCNSKIFFGCFYDEIFSKQQESPIDFIATGHYARIAPSSKGTNELNRAVDTGRDQSLSLSALSQNQLQKCLFPIGEYNNNQVRQLANEFQVPNSKRPRTKGMCFFGGIRVAELVSNYLDEQPGPIVDATTREHLGDHNGVWLHDCGQEVHNGLNDHAESRGPWYAIAKDAATRTVFCFNYYTYDAILARPKSEIKVEDIHWLSGYPPTIEQVENDNIVYKFKVSMKDGKSILDGSLRLKNIESTAGEVVLDDTIGGLIPGQTIVFYDEENNNKCFGSATISDHIWAGLLTVPTSTTKHQQKQQLSQSVTDKEEQVQIPSNTDDRSLKAGLKNGTHHGTVTK